MKKIFTAITITAIILFTSTVSAATIYTTVAGYKATITLLNMKEVSTRLKAGRLSAVDSMVKGKKALVLPPGMKVYIEEFYEGFVRVRLVGKHHSFWTFTGAIKK